MSSLPFPGHFKYLWISIVYFKAWMVLAYQMRFYFYIKCLSDYIITHFPIQVLLWKLMHVVGGIPVVGHSWLTRVLIHSAKFGPHKVNPIFCHITHQFCLLPIIIPPQSPISCPDCDSHSPTSQIINHHSDNHQNPNSSVSNSFQWTSSFPNQLSVILLAVVPASSYCSSWIILKWHLTIANIGQGKCLLQQLLDLSDILSVC